jgi:hypothetical protein
MAEDLKDFRVTFTAVSARGLGAGAGERLRAALAEMPGAGGVDEAGADARRRRVTATFWIAVRLGMADAARDGSRLAKEALTVAGLGDAQLVELSVSLTRRTRPAA